MHIPPLGGPSWGHFSQDPVTNQDIQNSLSTIQSDLYNAVQDHANGTLDFTTFQENIDNQMATLQNYCENIPNVNTQQLMEDLGTFQQDVSSLVGSLENPQSSSFILNGQLASAIQDQYYIRLDVGLPTG